MGLCHFLAAEAPEWQVDCWLLGCLLEMELHLWCHCDRLLQHTDLSTAVALC